MYICFGVLCRFGRYPLRPMEQEGDSGGECES